MMGIAWKVIVLAASVGTVILLVVQMPLPEEPIISASPKAQPDLRPPDPVPTAATEQPYQVPSVRTILEDQVSTSPDGTEQDMNAPPQPEEPKVNGTGPDGAQALPATYVVQQGDTPGSIARQHLSDATRWPEIVRANPGLKATSLRIGQVLQLPLSPAPDSQPEGITKQQTPPSVAQLAVHRVGPGDSLYRIARKYYGDSAHWTLIRDANPQLERDGVRELHLDSELIIPSLPKTNP